VPALLAGMRNGAARTGSGSRRSKYMKVRFSFFSLGFGARFAVSALCYAAAVALQIILPARLVFRFLVLVLCALPLLFLTAKNFSNKPADLGKEEWKPVTMKEIDRLANRMRTAKLVKVGDRSKAIAITVFFIFAMFFFVMLFGFSVCFFSACLYLILVPWLWFAKVENWYPKRLSDKLEIFLTVLNCPFNSAYKVIPMLRFDEDKLGRKIPEDIKVMIKPRIPPKSQKKPNDFVGVQFQMAINNGPDGEVPYVYAVFITRGRGPFWEAFSRTRFLSWVTEAGSDGEFGTVVLRLDTKSRGDGYHTKSRDVEELIGHVFKMLSAYTT
jgi:hypothetical protein